MLKYLVLIFILFLTSCTVPDTFINFNFEQTPANFFDGIWHGFIAPITLIWSLLDAQVTIYEVNNNGFWYNLGFLISVNGIFDFLFG